MAAAAARGHWDLLELLLSRAKPSDLKAKSRPQVSKLSFPPKGSTVQGVNSLGLPMRPGQRFCEVYYMKGDCRSGPNCRYDHPEGMKVTFSRAGYPLRPWVRDCENYVATGICDLRQLCRWHHPDRNTKRPPKVPGGPAEELSAADHATKVLKGLKEERKAIWNTADAGEELIRFEMDRLDAQIAKAEEMVKRLRGPDVFDAASRSPSPSAGAEKKEVRVTTPPSSPEKEARTTTSPVSSQPDLLRTGRWWLKEARVETPAWQDPRRRGGRRF